MSPTMTLLESIPEVSVVRRAPTGTVTSRAAARPDRADARGSGRSAATSAASTWPAAPVVLLSGAEANEYFFRAPDEDLDQAGGVPVHDADLRQGRGLRRLARAAPRDAAQPGAARGHDARARRRRSPTRSAGWWRPGATTGEIDLLDWFAELTIYTSSACLIGTKFREQLDGRFAAALPRPGARHRRAGLRRPVRADRVASGAATPPASELVELVAGHHRHAPGARHRGQRGAGPARRAHVVRIGDAHRRRDHRHVHLDDVRRAPHQLRHRRLDADRAAAAPRGDGRRRRRARRAVRRRLGGLLPGAARDPAARGGDQGGAAAAPAADPPAAGGPRGDGARRATRSRPASLVGGLAGDLEPDRQRLPRPGRASPRTATSSRARRTWSTGGPGSRSAPGSTAASARTSR